MKVFIIVLALAELLAVDWAKANTFKVHPSPSAEADGAIETANKNHY